MKPTLTPRARALLRKAVAAIARHPETLRMEDWMVHDPAVKGRSPYCGTAACFAGHVVLASGRKPSFRGSVADLARRLLGGSFDCDSLFYLSDWPERFMLKYDAAKSPRQRARILRARVAHWLRTGE
jgi:hypothetical protein